MSRLPAPSIEQFKAFVREHFAFLNARGFVERECPSRAFDNPVKVCYGGHGIILYIEGINWGFGAQVFVTKDDGQYQPLPIWPLVSHVSPAKRDDLPAQLLSVLVEAERVRQLPSPVFRGDLSAIEQAWAAHRVQVRTQKK